MSAEVTSGGRIWKSMTVTLSDLGKKVEIRVDYAANSVGTFRIDALGRAGWFANDAITHCTGRGCPFPFSHVTRGAAVQLDDSITHAAALCPPMKSARGDAKTRSRRSERDHFRAAPASPPVVHPTEAATGRPRSSAKVQHTGVSRVEMRWNISEFLDEQCVDADI